MLNKIMAIACLGMLAACSDNVEQTSPAKISLAIPAQQESKGATTFAEGSQAPNTGQAQVIINQDAANGKSFADLQKPPTVNETITIKVLEKEETSVKVEEDTVTVKIKD